jgi:tripartite ATP-independent transporter DctP family solute receptor
MANGIDRRQLIRSGLAAGAGLAGGVGFLGSSPASAQTVTMRLGAGGPITGTQEVALVKLKEGLESATQGRIKVTIFPDAQLGGNSALNNAVKAGTLDGTITDVPVLSGAVPEVDIFSMPFLFRDTRHALTAAKGSIGAGLKAKIEQSFACEVLGWGTQGGRDMWNSKHPIHTPDDVRGLKMRVQPSPIQADTYAAFGALPTPISYSELYTALQTGVIDGADPGPVDLMDGKLYQVTKYLTMTQHYHIILALIVSKAFVQKLSPQDQATLRDVGKKAADTQADNALAVEGTKLNELKGKGIQVFEMADRNAFVAKVEPVYTKNANRVGGANVIAEARKIT